MSKIKKAIALLEEHGYTVTKAEPQESEYEKAHRTGVIPEVWPPLVMSYEELEHFRKNCCTNAR